MVKRVVVRVVAAITIATLHAACHSDPLSVRQRGSSGGDVVALGRAATFSVLGATSVDDTGSPSRVRGDLGVSPGDTITGAPSVQGTVDHATLKSGVAHEDVSAALGEALSKSGSGLSGDLSGTTLVPGVYRSGGFALSGTMIFDAQGDALAGFVLQAPSLSVASGSHVLLAGGASFQNITWAIEDSADIGAGADFVGNVLAGNSITLGTGAVVQGRVLSRSGSVVMSSNTISQF